MGATGQCAYMRPPNKTLAQSEARIASVGQSRQLVLLRPGVFLVAGLLIATTSLVLVVHCHVLTATARCFDDERYIADNPLIPNPSWQSARRIMSEILNPTVAEGSTTPYR